MWWFGWVRTFLTTSNSAALYSAKETKVSCFSQIRDSNKKGKLKQNKNLVNTGFQIYINVISLL